MALHVSFMDRTSKSICGSYCVRCIDDKLLILEPVCDAYELVDVGTTAALILFTYMLLN